MAANPTLPLLARMEGRNSRPRAFRAPNAYETELHERTVRCLKKALRPDWRYTHPGCEIPLDDKRKDKLSRLGLRPGWPDLVLMPMSGVLHGLEFKRLHGSSLNDAQQDFLSFCRDNGIPYEIVRSDDEVRAVLDRWGCLTLRATRVYA